MSDASPVEKQISEVSVNEPITTEEKLQHIDLSNDMVIDKFKTAGEIASRALQLVVSRCKPDVLINELCTAADEYIEQQTGQIFNKSKTPISKGIAFPTCISVNNIVGHYSPLNSDKTKLCMNDCVKIDLAVHVDGYIANTATTVIVNDNSVVDGKLADVLSACYYAADATYRSLRPGNTNTQVTNIITGIAADFGMLV